MAGITALGTTYNLPNYTGELIGLTPADTPFLSAIGGLTGGGQTESTEFEWQTYDLRAAGQNTALEGADAPSIQNRVRANVTNVCQIHQEALGVTYTKQAATQQKSGSNNAERNPVSSELDWQVEQMLKQVARDVNYSFLQGTYQKPVDNTTARKTRGLLQAITTNVVNGGTALGSATTSATNDTFTISSHGLVANDQVVLDTIVTTTGVTAGTVYYVVTTTTNTFKVAATKGGAAIDLTGGDGTANVTKLNVITKDRAVDLLQMVYDNGGIQESETATLVTNSVGKRGLTKAFITDSNYQESNRNVGGVNVTTIETDFGTLNVMLDRHMPQGTIAVASLEQCMPVFLEVPSKGHMFVEPLAKTGAQDKAQIYGEVGLAYGNERAHGKITNLIIAL
ncbi:hypothetical protein DMH04_41330 [Kibdelosporangium aridum]|uniref:Phage major capsid protein n=1 Tax=Kibdelosporangium aridum TaxID=2030 RepID=A0A428YUT1_KIBAR|nr:DUF5309 family protein [Kibdelosporangium aridum]RSM73457.1 hypothetical protein DMH04_41330 [Kibdelosporangium aridum]